MHTQNLGFLAFLVLLAGALLAGGASAAAAPGQPAVRLVAFASLLLVTLSGLSPDWRRYRELFLLLGAILGLVALQLVPLPPAAWTMLPGRAALVEVARATGNLDSWRPLATVPDGAWNALFSLVVPAAALIGFACLSDRQRAMTVPLLLGVVALSALLGLLQISGEQISSGVGVPFGEASGLLANRNHQALLLAIGIPLTLHTAILEDRLDRGRSALAAGLIIFFILMIVATGSRAGLALALAALLGGMLINRAGLRRVWKGIPPPVAIMLSAGLVALIGGLVFLTMLAGNAEAVFRLFAMGVGEDMRARALPTLMEMIHESFPVGFGFGSFDAMFRILEPSVLLKRTYFNHAHNDWLEIVLDGGLFALLLLLAALGWWLWSATQLLRSGAPAASRRGLLGALVLLLILAASLVDYPARTPLMMMVTVIAACWLSDGSRRPAENVQP
ncbi:O-antigen ligase family protein [Sphingomonas sp. MMS12-HWE2-04]|uniref:O-antigen ligase family protein n=1 Tax=Sphingomonas sp. MMS12-HWE2-04 TaxID=3234199 RepID=UPI00384BD534